jgi:hypothetical protein
MPPPRANDPAAAFFFGEDLRLPPRLCAGHGLPTLRLLAVCRTDGAGAEAAR